MVDKNRFYGRTALITGAGSPKGIGFATAGILAASGAGVALTSTTDRIYDRAGELEKMGLGVKAYIADLMDRAQVKRLADSLIRDFDRIDILVNNAGMVQVGKEEEFLEMANLSPAAWDESIDRNLTTCFNITHALLPLMINNNYGRIINVSSVTGPLVSNPGATAYSAAKAAMIGMSRSLAIEVAKYGITVSPPLSDPGNLWYQTSTIEGSPVIDAWVKATEPSSCLALPNWKKLPRLALSVEI